MKLGIFTFLVALAISVTGCGTAQTFKAYEGPERTQDELAILDWSWSGTTVTSIDGKSNPKFTAGLIYDHIWRAELLPGKHTISYYTHIRKVGERGGTGVIDMKAGHVYITKRDSCFGIWWCSPYKGAAWIEDQATGEVVLGSKHLY